MSNHGIILLNIYALIILVVLCIIFFKKERLHREEDETYGRLLIVCVVTITVGIILGYISVYEAVPQVLIKLVNKAYLFGLASVIGIFTYYTSLISFDPEKDDLKKIQNRYTVAGLSSLAAIILLPLKVINIDGISSCEGPALYITLAVSGGYFAIIIYLLIKNIKNLNKKYIPIILITLTSLAITSIQVVIPQANFIINPNTVITCLIMYFTIENPDVKMIEQLEILKDQADKANHAKSEFLSNMSHEIRTPLNAIVGFSESLKDDQLTPDQEDKVDDIIMASNNLLDIVNGILDISKIEANKLEIIDKEYDIKSVLDELCALTKARMGDSGLDFRVNIDPSLPRVLYGDNVRLKQIVLNLLTNAVKYTKEGYVDFTVSSVIRDNVCRLIISVEDTGIGIKEESIPRLFSKFDRLNVEKSITIEGTGLGLAITKKLVELMNGTIIVQSVYGQGSKFTVSIDQRVISVKPKETPRPAVESKTIKAYGAKVLLVDDNELNIKVATTLLKKYDFNIDSCISGRECLEKIRLGNKYDIIFLDDMMPRMSGKEVLVALKKMENFNTPVIALTANAISGMKEEYLSLGFDDYLSKPIEKKELERVITTYIHKSNVQEMNSSSSSNASSIIDFDFQLPMLAGAHKEEVAEPKEEAPEIPKEEAPEIPKEENTLCKRLLIVDDNDVNLKVATSAFKNYSSEIVTVKSGSEAIEKVITEERFDLILLDDMMPEMDGPTTLDNLRDIDGFDVPTVLTTASSEDEVQDKLEEHHFDGYLSKPFKKEEIESLLNALLNK